MHNISPPVIYRETTLFQENTGNKVTTTTIYNNKISEEEGAREEMQQQEWLRQNFTHNLLSAT